MATTTENIVQTIRHPSRLYLLATKLGLTNGVSDEEHLKRTFKIRMGYPLDLDDPRTFNEKLQWLKLHDRNPLYTTLVDKAAVKDWVAERAGPEYVTPIYAVWDRAEDIDISGLPRSFVLKCNHDSGGIAICRDKDDFNLASAKRLLASHLKKNWYWVGREWAYKDVRPCILAEEFLDPAKAGGGVCHDGEVAERSDTYDYKFFCFDGEPRFVLVSYGLSNHEALLQRRFLWMDWSPAPFSYGSSASLPAMPSQPQCFDEMVRLARLLSEGIPFVRVDLFQYEGRPRFSEMTLYPNAGWTPFEPAEYDRIIGDMLQLPC